MKQKYAKYISLISFLVMIFSFSIINVIKPNKGFSDSENRFLATKPKLSVESLMNGEFAVEVEEYITDQFLCRDQFIGIKTEVEHLAGKKDTNNVYFAQDGYLIEKHDNSKIDVELLKRNTEHLYEFLQTNSQKLGDNHVSVMLVPTASEILKDKLPPYATQFNQDAMLATVRNGMEYGTFIDLRGILNDHKEEYIYYKTDHHWTTNGAFYAYRVWCDTMGIQGKTYSDFKVDSVTNEFYGTIYSKARLISTKPDTMYVYMPNFHASYKVEYNLGERVTNSLYEDNYLEKRDKYAYYLGGNNAIVKIECQNQNGKKLLIIKDSFAHSFAPFVANDYSEVHMLDLRYINMSIKDYIDQNGITDVLVLYNTINFATENTLVKLNE